MFYSCFTMILNQATQDEPERYNGQFPAAQAIKSDLFNVSTSGTKQEPCATMA